MSGRYVVVAPARDEAKFAARTLSSVAAQTRQPDLFVVVDDGSVDATPAILESWRAKLPYLRVVRRERGQGRNVGTGVINAFYAGLDTVDLDEFDYVCKLDLDLDLPPRYFEVMLERMAAEPRLGTCSGKAYYPGPDGRLISESISDEMSVGALKFYRTACFRQIGGFVREVMWDGIDCHRCRMLGWIARSWDEPDIRVTHLRPMGSSEVSVWNGRKRHGFGQWFMGTSLAFMTASALYRMTRRPFLIGGLAMWWGFVASMLSGKPRLADPRFRSFLRRCQWNMLLKGKKKAIAAIDAAGAAIWDPVATLALATVRTSDRRRECCDRRGKIMKAFVTGHLGYIGSHLVDVLKREGHTVVGCDLGLFDGCEWDPLVRPDVELRKDVRNIGVEDLRGVDCVMHLAALSNDPMGALDGKLTLDINRDASIRLAKLAKQAGVPRFLFAGSCSVYGKGVKLDLDESDPLQPLTAYAQSKIETEIEVSKLADDSFSPAYLRNSTAYGYSPMLRIDLVVNNLLGSALSYGEIRIQSDGSPWRPLIHCRDIARAFLAFANAPRAAIHNRAVNVGANSENYQVKNVGDQVRRLVPSAKITYTGEVGADPRNYRVRFDLLNALLPDFKLDYDLVRGMDELHRSMIQHGFGKDDFEGDRFVRLRKLKSRMSLLS